MFKAFAGLGYQRARTAKRLEEIADPLTAAQRAVLDALGITSILPSKGGA